ncbi:DNA polymerase/3'-5' exonuclease PolX [Pelagibacterium halotolerans]|uniref:DNA polymerase/3'-5' exonuclease PolX n=1 Tax=Pelagibacterium halotolerans TaxID=531813 RepID=UPI00384E2D6B
MSVENAEVAAIFSEMADLLEIEGANPFRVRAYRNAAQMVRRKPQRFADLVKENADLEALPTIGEDLAEKIAEIVATGHMSALDDLKREVPSELVDLAALPGLGPKRVKVLYDQLGVRGLKDLRRVVESGEIGTLRGFGPKLTESLAVALRDTPSKAEKRFLLADVEGEADTLADYLREAPGVESVTIAGSFRRRRETVGDLDVLVVAEDGEAVSAHFVAFEKVAKTLWAGTTKVSVVLRSGLQVDLRVVPRESFGAALLYFTGSKAHTIALRNMAVERKWKLNEYGLFSGDDRIAGKSEDEIYGKFGLELIPPELREDRGEIAAARKGTLPNLIHQSDIRGDLHAHTDWSDGTATLEQMAEAAQERGYAYLAITDHSPHLGVVHGLDAERLTKQIVEIDRINKRLDGFTLLKAVEVDILKDGTLDLPDDILERLDIVVASIHSAFDLPRDAQTERMLRAIDHPLVTVIGHPTGRRIGKRGPYAIDMERVIGAAAKAGCCLEINSQPDRLDLDDGTIKAAKDAGVKLVISTDAHGTEMLELIRHGVDQARRGWVEARDVVNTRPLADLWKLLKR